ncbi:gfo/Idh/MocA family oxidoreductase, partial [Streptomyces anthocyanicus]
VAATLCAERAAEPYVLVHGSSGRVTFWYKQDRVLLQRGGHGPEEFHHDRTDLLENLVDHLTTGAPLLVPPDETGAFMRVVEAIRRAPDPEPLPEAAWRRLPGERRRVVPGIDGLVAAAADTLSLYSELGAPWAPRTEHPRHEVSTR